MIFLLILKQLKYVLIIAFALAIYTLYSMYSRQQTDNERLNSYIGVLESNFKSYRVKAEYTDCVNAAKIKLLTNIKPTIQPYNPKAMLLIKNLKFKLKSMQSILDAGPLTNTITNTKIQYIDTTKCLAFSDKFTTLSGCFQGDSINLLVENRDSLTTQVSSIPRHRLLWWSWGVKAIQLDILSKNPNSKFTYLKYIELPNQMDRNKNLNLSVSTKRTL